MNPCVFTWDGDHMVPLARFKKLCDRQFVVHEHYTLETVQQRSAQSHNHFFACIHSAWENLPEIHGNRWLTPDALRAWALIQAGYCDETTFICHSKAEAIRLAGYLRSLDGQCEVVVDGRLVARRVAKSQSVRAMPGKEFQASKQAVLDVIAKLIGVEPATLAAQSPRIASPSVAPHGQARERERA